MNKSEFTLKDLEPLIREMTESGGEFRLYPRGTSMLPLLRQGVDSVALVKIDAPLKRYDIPLYRRPDGSFVLHRILRVEGEGLCLCGDNQLTLERGVPPSAVLCRVGAVYRGDKRYEVESFRMRAYARIWCCMSLRRVLFFGRRCRMKLRSLFSK